MELLDGIDYGALYHFQTNRMPVFDRLCPWLLFLGGYPFLTACVLVGWLVLRIQGRFRSILFLVVSFVAGAILAETLKFATARVRPADWSGTPWAGFSFPSNEAMVSAIVYLSLAYLLSRNASLFVRWLIFYMAAVISIIAIGFSEIYLRHHFVSDVLAGWLGSAIVLVAAAWISSITRD